MIAVRLLRRTPKDAAMTVTVPLLCSIGTVPGGEPMATAPKIDPGAQMRAMSPA